MYQSTQCNNIPTSSSSILRADNIVQITAHFATAREGARQSLITHAWVMATVDTGREQAAAGHGLGC